MASPKQSVWATLPPITLGALSTATLMYPVDLVRALRMSTANDAAPRTIAALLRDFYALHGLKGFVTQGVGPEMLRATYMRVLKFFLFPITHQAIYGRPEKQGTGLTKAVAAAVCSLPEGFTIQPMEVAKICLQLDKEKKYKNNSMLVLKEILSTRGWTGLFVGYFGVQYRQTAWTATYFATLKYFTDLAAKVIPDEHKQAQQLVGGFQAGMFGALFNTPGDVIRSSFQRQVLQTPSGHVPFSLSLCVAGVTDFFAHGATIVQHNGFKGLYSGFGIKALHLGGSGALLAAFIPMFKTLMGVRD